MRLVTKTKLAEILCVSKSRVSQYVKAGMPVRADGLVDADEATEWIAERIDPARAPITRGGRRLGAVAAGAAAAPPLPFAWVIRATLRAAHGAAIEEGVPHQQAGRLARLAALMVWDAVEENHDLVEQLTMDEADFELPGDPGNVPAA